MIKSLFQIILYVQNMDLMVRFYRDIIGLTVQSPAGLSDYSNEYVESMRQSLIDKGVKMGEIFSPVPGSKVSNGVDPEGFPFSLDWHELCIATNQMGHATSLD